MYPLPKNEESRLNSLDKYNLRNIRQEAGFEEIAALAADIAETPIALISIIERDIQCFAGLFGAEIEQTSRSDAFCSYTILSDGALIVPDALLDERFADNPYVTGEPFIRFYAGVAVHAGGHRVGSLCVMDRRPRDFGSNDVRRLVSLARIADRMIESRLAAILKSKSETRLESIIESMPVAVSIYDHQDGFVQANTRYVSTFLPRSQQPPRPGASFEEVLNDVEKQGVRMWIDGEGTDWKQRRLDLRRRNIGFYEMHLSTGIWLACREVKTQDGGLLATFTDITTLKDREAALAIQSALLRSTLESIDEGVAVFDRGGNLIACSEAYFRLLELPPELRLIGTPIRSIVRSLVERGYFGIGAARLLEEIVMKSLGARNSRRNEFSTPDGRFLEINRTVAEDGRIIVTCRDITERKATDRIKDEFVSTVSHELRTPLTSITGSLGLLAAGTAGDLPARARRLVDIARDNVERLTRLVDDLLDIDKVETGQVSYSREDIDLNDLARRAVEQNLPFAERYGVVLEGRFADVPIHISGDPHRLLQVASNLISNAVKHSPHGETVTVSVLRQGEAAGLTVEDHGQGIPEHFRSQIFRRFAQADASDERARQGTGLGLAISRAIVEQHDGTIGYKSVLNLGTTFHFMLPLKRANQQQQLKNADGPGS